MSEFKQSQMKTPLAEKTVECGCGSIVKSCGYEKHKTTKKHMAYLIKTMKTYERISDELPVRSWWQEQNERDRLEHEAFKARHGITE